jgi:GDP-L-fucose synthase
MGKILITGANGLVGYAFRKMDNPDFIFITRADTDLTNYTQTKELFERIRPEKVIHLAAVVGGIGGNMIHSGEYFRNNTMININVLECSRIVGVKKLVSFMSTCVFPDKCAYPLNEKDLHNGPPHPSNFGYAYAKRMLEVQSSAYRREWNCDYIVVIPTNIYGPNDNWRLTDGHVIPSLIHRCYLAKRNKEDLTIWGSGKPLREFVLSDDIASLTLWALDNYSEDSPIILTSGIERSIRELAELVVHKIQFKGNLVFDSTKPDGQFRKPSDTTKLRSYRPDFQFTSLEDGLDITVNWFTTHYPTIRM